MEIIGTKRANVGDRDLLKPLAIEDRPQAFPGTSGTYVIFGYDKVFEENRQEEALVLCESLEDMQACHDRMHGKTSTAWYTAVKPEESQLELVPCDFDEIDIKEDFQGIL